jgi:hypothetical protein
LAAAAAIRLGSGDGGAAAEPATDTSEQAAPEKEPVAAS